MKEDEKNKSDVAEPDYLKRNPKSLREWVSDKQEEMMKRMKWSSDRLPGRPGNMPGDPEEHPLDEECLTEKGDASIVFVRRIEGEGDAEQESDRRVQDIIDRSTDSLVVEKINFVAERVFPERTEEEKEADVVPVEERKDVINGVRVLPFKMTPRIESGALQFDEDYPGLFFRGDDAMSLVTNLSIALKDMRELDSFRRKASGFGSAETFFAIVYLESLACSILDNVILGGEKYRESLGFPKKTETSLEKEEEVEEEG